MLIFSKLDIDDERDREKDVSNLSTRPVVRIKCELADRYNDNNDANGNENSARTKKKIGVKKMLYRLDIDLEMCHTILQ